MARNIQAFDYQQPIVDPETGLPTKYFLDMLFGKDNVASDTQDDVAGKADKTITLTAGTGLDGGGDISQDRTFDLNATLDDLSDVDTTTTPPTDGQALVYDLPNTKWKPGSVASGGPSVRGCLAYRSTALVAQNYTVETAIPFNAELYDTDAIHDNVTNPTRFRPPVGATYVTLSATVVLVNIDPAAEAFIFVKKNGAFFFGTPQGIAQADASNTAPRVNLKSAPIPCVGGTDYFELIIRVAGDASVDVVASETYFALEVVEAVVPSNSISGARARRTANLVLVANANVIPMQAVGSDTGGLYDPATGRFKIKTSGYYQVSLRARTTGGTTLITCGIAVNGAYTVEMGGNVASGAMSVSGSGLVYLNANDTVCMGVWSTAAGTTLDANSNLTWMSIVGPFGG